MGTGDEATEHEPDHCIPSGAEIKNQYSHTFTNPYVFIVFSGQIYFSFTFHYSSTVFLQCQE